MTEVALKYFLEQIRKQAKGIAEAGDFKVGFRLDEAMVDVERRLRNLETDLAFRSRVSVLEDSLQKAFVWLWVLSSVVVLFIIYVVFFT